MPVHNSRRDVGLLFQLPTWTTSPGVGEPPRSHPEDGIHLHRELPVAILVSPSQAATASVWLATQEERKAGFQMESRAQRRVYMLVRRTPRCAIGGTIRAKNMKSVHAMLFSWGRRPDGKRAHWQRQ